MENKPLVSIIMTTYNCEKTLPETLGAIDNQDYPNIEVIVKDGESNDNTCSLIDKFSSTSRFTVKLKSCSDNGIYDAMNQGFDLSSGDIIVFCSDKLADGSVVSTMVEAIEAEDNSCIGAHADLVYAEGSNVKRCWHMGKGKIEDGWMPGHPTLYLKRSVYEKYGLYKTDYRIAADYEFMIRILKDNRDKLVYVPKVIVSMYYGGTSTNSTKAYSASFKEAVRALKENGIKHAWLITVKRSFRLMRQFR